MGMQVAMFNAAPLMRESSRESIQLGRNPSRFSLGADDDSRKESSLTGLLRIMSQVVEAAQSSPIDERGVPVDGFRVKHGAAGFFSPDGTITAIPYLLRPLSVCLLSSPYSGWGTNDVRALRAFQSLSSCRESWSYLRRR